MKDNLQNTSGRAGFTPKPTPLTEAFRSLGKNPPTSPLQMAAAELGKNPPRTSLSEAMQMFKITYQSPSPSLPAQAMQDKDTEDEEKVQMKEDESSVSATGGSTGSLPGSVLGKMEGAFGTSFSDVNVHSNSSKASDMGALAYAQGNNVHFAPGQYNPDSKEGQELIGHELTHVVQQREGRVKATTQAKGVAVNDDPALEQEADVMGNKAAEGKLVQNGGDQFWFDDEQGEFFFDHWRNGNGEELFLNDAEWSAYMRNNEHLATVSIASHLYSLDIKNSGRISGAFHGDTGKNDWRSGHGMLNGSNSFVGDLEYSGYAHVNSDGSISYLLSFTWNDRMDPNSNHFGDTVGAALFPGTPYNVHISWTDLITITPK